MNNIILYTLIFISVTLTIILYNIDSISHFLYLRKHLDDPRLLRNIKPGTTLSVDKLFQHPNLVVASNKNNKIVLNGIDYTNGSHGAGYEFSYKKYDTLPFKNKNKQGHVITTIDFDFNY